MAPSPYRVVAAGLVAAGAFIADALFIGAWIVGNRPAEATAQTEG